MGNTHFLLAGPSCAQAKPGRASDVNRLRDVNLLLASATLSGCFIYFIHIVIIIVVIMLRYA